MSYSYLVDLSDKQAPRIDGEFVEKLTRFNPSLRGLKTEIYNGNLRIKLRVAGLTRWHIGRDAPRILGILLRKHAIPTESVTFESMVMEPGRSHLRDGQGRTEMTRRPRSERQADGRPWDHIAWEGEDFTDGETSAPGPRSPGSA